MRVGSKNSSSPPVVEAEQSAKPLTTHNLAVRGADSVCRQRKQGLREKLLAKPAAAPSDEAEVEPAEA